MASTEHIIDTDEFLRNLIVEHEFVTETRDGPKVRLVLTQPRSEMMARATRAVNMLADSPSKYIIANNLVRFACRSCIKGITDENVVPFLKQLSEMPPLAPVVRECLDRLNVSEEMVELIETSMDEKSLTQPER